MKKLIVTMALFGLSTPALAYDLQCKTSSLDISLIIIADGSDGSLDRLEIGVDGVKYGESDISAGNFEEELKTYNIDDNGVQANFPMKDGKRITISLSSGSDSKVYSGKMTIQSDEATKTVRVNCEDIE